MTSDGYQTDTLDRTGRDAGLPHAARPPVGAYHPMTEPAAPRVSEPLVVMWQGVEYPVQDWDVHGFRLARPIARAIGPGRGRVSDFTLLIGSRGTRIEMRVQARPVEDDSPQPVAFRFVDLDRAQAEVLHRIVDQAIHQQALSLTRLLNETEQTRVARQETTARTRRMRGLFQVTLACLALAAATSVIWSRMTTVHARYAAVTARATAVAAPVVGVVTALPGQVGARVLPGDVLAYVRPADLERRLEALIQERRLIEADLAEARAQRDLVTAVGSVTETGLDADLARLDTALALAEQRLRLAEQQFAAMQAQGLPTPRRLAERAQQESTVLAARIDVLETRARRDALIQSQTLARLGLVPGTGQQGSGTRDALDLRLTRLMTDLDHSQAREAELIRGEPVVSPCDCTLSEINLRVGEWADPANPLAVLVDGSGLTIHALIPNEDARSLSIGTSAAITLADGRRIDGRVARMNYAAHWPGYSGLQDNVFAADRFARVEIETARALGAPVGMTAQVRLITSSWLESLRAATGF